MFLQLFNLLNLMCLYTFLNAANNFGYVKVQLRDFELYKGPKRRTCCVSTVHIDSPTKITQTIQVTEDIRLTHLKIVGTLQGKELLKVYATKPCANMMVKAVFQPFLNMTEDCTVVKGPYVLKTDIEAMSNKFYNGQYFYGNMSIKTNIYGDGCNLFCNILTLDMSPKYKGTFDLLINKIEQCPGPKRKECAVTTVRIVNQCHLYLDIDVKEDVKTTKGKIVVLVKGKETLRLQLKDPCKHLFLKPLLQTLLNATSDCLIKKGFHQVDVDIQEVARKYYNGEFLFGAWTFKSVFYNEQCTFSCTVIEVSIVPKQTSKNEKDEAKT